MSLVLITPPVAEPVTLAAAKAHLKIDTADEDGLITTLITAARARAEWHTGRAFMPQRWEQRFDRWPPGGVAELLLPPLQAVTAVSLTTINGQTTSLDPARYSVDAASVPARVMLGPAPPHLRDWDCLTIAFTAGYGDTVPQAICAAILQIVTDLYSHRGDEAEVVSRAGQALLAPYRIFKL